MVLTGSPEFLKQIIEEGLLNFIDVRFAGTYKRLTERS